MKILTKYLLKESILPMAIGLGGFIIFISVELLYQLSDIIVRNRIPLIKLFVLLYYNLPYFTVLGIPVGVLLAIFWVLSQLGTGHELMALQTHGIPTKRVVIPFLLLSLILSLGAYLLNDFLVPNFNHKANEALIRYVYRRPKVTVKMNTFFKGQKDKYFYVKRFDPDEKVFNDVIIYEIHHRNTRVVYAKKAYEKKGEWYLKDGRIFTVDRNGYLKLDMEFDEMQMDIKQDVERFISAQKTARDMTSRELKKRIKDFRALGLDVSDLLVEFHSKFSLSIGPLIIVLIGVPISLLFNIQSKSWGVILTFILIVLYQGSCAWLAAMGKEGIVDPVLSAWLPDILFAVVGFSLFVLLDTNIMYRFKEKFGKFLSFSIFILFLLIPTPGNAAEKLTVSSEGMFYRGEDMVLYGDVRMEYKNSILEASTVTVHIEDEKAKYLVAVGNVRYTFENKKKEKETYIGEKLKVKFDEDVAIAYKVKGETKFKLFSKKEKKIKLYGDEVVVHIDRDNYTEIKKGFVTTCDFDKLYYRYEAQYIELFPSDKLIAYNVVMYLFGVPVVYYPVYFFSLKDPKQPLEFSLSSTMKNGWIMSYNFNFPTGENEYGNFGMKWMEKGKGAGTTLNFNASHRFTDELSSYLKYSDTLPKDSEIHSRILKMGLNDKLSKNLTLSTTYQRSWKTNLSDIGSGSTIYGLILSGKFLSGKLNLKFLDSFKNNGSNFSGTYSFPSISLSKAKYSINLSEDKKLNISLAKFAHSLTFPHEKNVSPFLSFYDDYHVKGNASVGVSTGGYDVYGPIGIKTISSSYNLSYSMKGGGENFFKFLKDDTFSLNPLTYSPIPGTTISTNYSNKFGYFFTSDKKKGFRLANILNSSLKFESIPNVSVGLSHKFTRAIQENGASFKNNKNVNLLTISDSFKIPPINLKIGSKISYDFEKEEKNWSDLLLTTDQRFRFLLNWGMKTSTIYKVYDKRFDYTKYTISGDSKGKKHSFSFSKSFVFKYDVEKPIDKFVNKVKLTLNDLGNLRKLSLNSEFHTKTDPFEISYMKLKGSMNFIDWSLNLNALLKNKKLSMNHGFSFPKIGIKLNLKESLTLDPFKLTSLSISLNKDLHCLVGNVLIDMKYKEGKLDFDKITLELKIKDFPNKAIRCYPLDKGMEFGLF